MIGVPSGFRCTLVINLRRVALMLAVDLADRLRRACAARASSGEPSGKPLVDKIVEARQLAQPDLPAEFVEARHAALAIADDVERREIDRGVEPRPQVEVLQELRMILQLEQAEPLAPHADSAQFDRPPSCILAVALPRNVSMTGTWRTISFGLARSRNSIMSGTSGCSR